MVALTQKRYDMALGRCPWRVGAILYGCPHPKAVRYGIGALPLSCRGNPLWLPSPKSGTIWHWGVAPGFNINGIASPPGFKHCVVVLKFGKPI